MIAEAEQVDVAAPHAFEQLDAILDDLDIRSKVEARASDESRPFLQRFIQRKWRFTADDRQAMLAPIDDLIGLVERKDIPTSQREREIGIQKIEIAFQIRRQQLLGGGAVSWLVELANPSAAEFQNRQAQFVSYFRHWILSISGTTTARFGSLVLGMAVMTISMFYFLSEGPALISAAMRLSPLDDKYERELFSEFDRVSRAVVIATLLSAVVQGLLAGVGFYFAGMSSGFLLTMLTMVFAMIPFVGAAAVWVPAALWLIFVDERMLAGIMLAIYGACIVSMADNVIKPLVLHGQSKLHPLLALLSVLGGVQALGPIGILVGPMVVSFLQALLNMLHTEIMAMESVDSAKNTAS
jgi:predicted PurR-regulated permease PerM